MWCICRTRKVEFLVCGNDDGLIACILSSVNVEGCNWNIVEFKKNNGESFGVAAVRFEFRGTYDVISTLSKSRVKRWMDGGSILCLMPKRLKVTTEVGVLRRKQEQAWVHEDARWD